MKIETKMYIYPTDTVWGIGTSIFDEWGPSLVAKAKNTSNDKPLSILFSDLNSLKEFFDIPSTLSDTWLTRLFNLESTLGLPSEWSKGKIPNQVFQNKPHICVRLLDHPEIASLLIKVEAPILSTSVNRTGEPPALTYEEANNFKEKHCPKATIISQGTIKTSGNSSTMILINKDLSFNLLREGNKINEIKDLLQLLSA
ncbi:MAG: Sua5/YciO/YrdC/YwlC family protein [Bacteriovoracaceae bacterium]|nr:Sua5/YciO/YrdC/YwlC family protein [Bacteriovoracaceae bacterium]